MQSGSSEICAFLLPKPDELPWYRPISSLTLEGKFAEGSMSEGYGMVLPSASPRMSSVTMMKTTFDQVERVLLRRADRRESFKFNVISSEKTRK